MRKIFVTYHTGYCGMDGHELVEFEETDPDELIAEDLYIRAVQHAESYGVEMCSDDCDNEDCTLEHPGSCNIEAAWEDYAPKKHDGYLR